MLLRWHVTQGAFVGIEFTIAMRSYQRNCKAPVGKFQVEVFINKDVLWLEVTMAYAHSIVDVIECTQQLEEEVSCGGL